MLGATLRKREDVNGEEDVLLAAVVAQLDGLPLIGEQSEIGGHVADLERHVGNLRFAHLVSKRRRGNCGNQEKTYNNGAFHKDSIAYDFDQLVTIPSLVL